MFEIAERAKILFLDIETAPLTVHTWGIYEQNALHVLAPGFLLAFSFKWQHERKVQVRCLPDYPGYAKNKRDDSKLLTELHSLLEACDICIAHNGDRFDVPKINARFIELGLPPPSPYKTVDTLKIARKHFRFDEGCKLDSLGRYLHVGHKVRGMSIDIWLDCMAGKNESWEKMRRYAERDTALLERVYNKLRPWTTTHPNLGFYSRKADACPVCESSKLKCNGRRFLSTGYRQQYKCMSCNHQFVTGKLLRFEHETRTP